MDKEWIEKGAGYLIGGLAVVLGIFGLWVVAGFLLVIGIIFIYIGMRGDKSKKTFKLINEHIEVKESKLIISEKGVRWANMIYHPIPRLEIKILNDYERDIIIDKIRWDIIINDKNIEDNANYKEELITIPNQSQYTYQFINFNKLNSNMLHIGTKTILKYFIIYNNIETEIVEVPITLVGFLNDSKKDFWRF